MASGAVRFEAKVGFSWRVLADCGIQPLLMADLNIRNHHLSPELLQALERLGFAQFTPIQALSFPPLRAGKDLIGESQTGSGKTLAFALPLLEKIDTRQRMLQGLVMCPTRELSEQVTRTIRSAGRFKKDLLVATIVGGEPVFRQLKILDHGVQIVVGTPGRILDLIERGRLDLRQIQTVILDEADRMLDMGFSEALEQILQVTPASRQTILFSATFPPTIERLSQRYQKSAVRVTVEVNESEKPQIEQWGYLVDDNSRIPTLTKLLSNPEFESVLVFCNFKASVDNLTAQLKTAGIRADKIHGDLEQSDRDRVMVRFRNGSVRVLVATDVAARGLDIAGLDAVFNFEIAKDLPTYVHRIGRTGRAGKSGTAVTLWSASEKAKLERIEAFTGNKILQKKAEQLKSNPATAIPQLETIEISGGRKDKLRPGDILGALTGPGCEIAGTAIGKIEIKDRISYVAVEKAAAYQALRSLQAGKIKGRRFAVSIVTATAPSKPNYFQSRRDY